MPFNKENFFTEGNSEEYFFARTNPLANGGNAEILKIEDCGGCCDLQLDFSAATTEGVTTFTLNAPTSGYNTKYIKIQITDGAGNFVTGVGTGTVSSIAIDTSTLTGNDWSVIIEISTGESDILNCDCVKRFSFGYDGGTLAIDTEALWAPVLRITEVGGTLAITTKSLGLTFPALGPNIPFQVELENTGNEVLTVGAITVTSQVLSASIPQFANVIYPGQKRTLSAVANGNLAAGAKTGSIVVNSDGGNITLAITYTIV
jgi:hypothetical protein